MILHGKWVANGTLVSTWGIKNELNITFDIFKEIRKDIFMERQQIPDYWGTNGKG